MFKDVMVLLDGADEDEVRLAHAESIAVRFAAHLTGLCISPIPEYGLAFAGEPGFVAADTVISLEERARTEAERVLPGGMPGLSPLVWQTSRATLISPRAPAVKAGH